MNITRLFANRVTTTFLSVVSIVAAVIVGVPNMRARVTAQTPLPDLIVRQDILSEQWVVRDETFSATACSVIEGGVQPGTRRVMRFTVMTPNIGSADLALGDPNAHVAANDGLYEFATCHNHFHFRHYTLYQLIDPATGTIWRSAKHGFCMLDTDPTPAYMGMQPPQSPQFLSCGRVGIPGNQGISHGWADTYRFFLAGQYFVLDGGDGQAPVPPGRYIVRITVDPPFIPQAGEPCRFLDSNGFCHQLPESDYTNNVAQIDVTIPGNPGRSGYGPLSGATLPTSDADEHDPPVK